MNKDDLDWLCRIADDWVGDGKQLAEGREMEVRDLIKRAREVTIGMPREWVLVLLDPEGEEKSQVDPQGEDPNAVSHAAQDPVWAVREMKRLKGEWEADRESFGIGADRSRGLLEQAKADEMRALEAYRKSEARCARREAEIERLRGELEGIASKGFPGASFIARAALDQKGAGAVLGRGPTEKTCRDVFWPEIKKLLTRTLEDGTSPRLTEAVRKAAR